MDLTEKTLESREVYRGRILRVREDRVLLPNGQEAQREIVEHPGGVGILALDADGCAVMVRQYRYAFGQTLLEIPAGKREKGAGGRLQGAGGFQRRSRRASVKRASSPTRRRGASCRRRSVRRRGSGSRSAK